MRKQDKKKKIIIGSLLGVLLLMVAGYAAFSSLLNISGTAGIAGQWNIEITEITPTVVSGSPTSKTASIGQDKLSATFETELLAPGDVIEYNIKVENKGNINATLTSMIPAELKSTNPAIEFTKSGLAVGDTLNAGDSKTLTIQVKYLDVTEVASLEKTKFKIFLEFSQVGGGTTKPTGKAALLLMTNEVTSGDGLYADDAEIGRYIYKGSNPNNYITFNNETWRILSVENDGTIKIIRNESLTNGNNTSHMNFDSSQRGSYCTRSGQLGCNAWAANANLVGSPAEFSAHYPNGNATSDTSYYSGTVSQDSSLNTYLNNDYYNGLLEEAKNQITAHNFNVGTPGMNTDTEDMATNVQQEASYKWNGKVGLMTVTEALRTINNPTCTTLQNSYNNYTCGADSWLLTLTTTDWTITPYPDTSQTNRLWVRESGSIGYSYSYHSYGTRPVVYLNSDIELEGEGTSTTPYTIKSQA